MSPVRGQMWIGAHEASLGADVDRLGPVPGQMWARVGPGMRRVLQVLCAIVEDSTRWDVDTRQHVAYVHATCNVPAWALRWESRTRPVAAMLSAVGARLRVARCNVVRRTRLCCAALLHPHAVRVQRVMGQL